MKFKSVARVDQVIKEFYVWPSDDMDLPFVKFKIKVLRAEEGNYTGLPNVAILESSSKIPQRICGLGNTVDEALEDCLKHFFIEIEKHRKERTLEDKDFEWSDPDFF